MPAGRCPLVDAGLTIEPASTSWLGGWHPPSKPARRCRLVADAGSSMIDMPAPTSRNRRTRRRARGCIQRPASGYLWHRGALSQERRRTSNRAAGGWAGACVRIEGGQGVPVGAFAAIFPPRPIYRHMNPDRHEAATNGPASAAAQVGLRNLHRTSRNQKKKTDCSWPFLGLQNLKPGIGIVALQSWDCKCLWVVGPSYHSIPGLPGQL